MNIYEKEKYIEQPPAKISDAEREVLAVLWNRGAVRSFLNRLIAKGIVRLLDDEPIYHYETVYDQETIFGRKVAVF